MAPATTPPRPGSLTVPILFGWELIVVVLVVLVGLAVAFFVMAAAGRNLSERAEMQAWLEARSHRYEGPRDESDESDEPIAAEHALLSRTSRGAPGGSA